MNTSRNNNINSLDQIDITQHEYILLQPVSKGRLNAGHSFPSSASALQSLVRNVHIHDQHKKTGKKMENK